KSRMELHIENRENGRMILNSVQSGPLVWPTVVEEDDTVMSDSDESGVTHMEISSPFKDLSDIGSPGVSPPSPDYIPGPEEPQSPSLPDFVPEPVYPEYMPQEDEVFPVKEQSLPAAASPTAQSPDYVPKSDPKADLGEDDDEDPEEDPVDYPADGGDDGDDEDESSEDDKDDDEVDIEADDEEEKEHPALADSAVVALPAVNQAPSAEETEPFKTDESVATPPPHPRVTARISIPAPVPTPVWSDAEVARLLAISTPPSSPLSPWSSPLPQIPSPPLPPIPSPSLPVSPPLPVSSPVPMLSPSPPASLIRLLGYRAAMIRLRAEAASTSYSLLLPPPIILSHTRLAAPSSGTPPLLGIAFGPAYEVGESSSAAARPAGGLRADYGFVATMDREIRHDPERDVGYGITDSWVEMVETLQGAPFRDRCAHVRTARLMETEARMSREAWGRSMDASDLSADRRRQTVITEMLATDHRRQKQLTEALKLIKRLQTQMAEFERQQGPAKGHAQPELPEEAENGTKSGHEVIIAPEITNTTSITNAQLQEMINQGITAALAARDAYTNGVDIHYSGTCARRNERATHECTYPDFMKCQPLNFKGTEGVVELTQWIEKMELCSA
ncbi:hypothetical protein Tco_0513768, partial [Tanacetum coccineum]